MKALFDGLEEDVGPVASMELDATGQDLLPPDDDDVIRPAAEEALEAASENRGSMRLRTAPLAKHLVWTFGPHHRDFPFMLQLRVEIEGDRLVSVDPEVGWLHQGIEKSLEHTGYEDAFGLIEKLHPSASLAHQLAWSFAVERRCGIERDVPEKAQLWRVVLAEITRVLEHIRVLSSLVLAHSDRRAQQLFVEAARTVTSLLDLAGHRDAISVVQHFGGLASEIDEAIPATIERMLPDALVPLQLAGDRLWNNPAFVDSLTGRGSIPADAALDLGLSGPVLRACGVRDDVRTQDPYFAYGKVAPRVPVHHGGDALSRFAVRLDEIAASSAVALRALAAFTAHDGLISVEREALPRDKDGKLSPAPGTSSVSLELPSGELSLTLSSDGSARPKRARFRGPSFPLAAALSRVLAGARLDDVVPVLHGLGMSGTEVDR